MYKGDQDNFTPLRNKLKTAKALSSNDFGVLVGLLEKDPIEILEKDHLTLKEIQIIGKALQKSKIQDIDGLIGFLTGEDSKRTPVLLYVFLNKKCKIDTNQIDCYLVQCL